jgi:endonuclease/exonuclease/phosphatase family metal-dependent hydrolase
MVLGDLNTKIGKEPWFRPTTGRFGLHEICNEYGGRVVDFATFNNMIISSICFDHKRIHKETGTSPNGKTKNQIDHVLIDKRHASDVMDVRSYRGVDCDSDHFW